MVMRLITTKQRRLLLTVHLSVCIPHNPANLIDIMQFSKLEGVVDLIYNPRRTILLLQAEMMEIPHCDGFAIPRGSRR